MQTFQEQVVRAFLWLTALRNTLRIVPQQYPSLVVPRDHGKSLHNSHFHSSSSQSKVATDTHYLSCSDSQKHL